jgi:hypothetical protein
MEWTEKAFCVAHEAERQVRALLAEAAVASADYKELESLTALARALGQLAKVATSSAALTATPGKSRPRKRTAVATKEYPKYSKRGMELVKTGWSKKERKTYEQKCPRDVVARLVSALAEFSDGSVVNVGERIIPNLDSSGVPSYQAYVALGWLKAAGIVVQHGRSGYSMNKQADIASHVDEVWHQLPDKVG